MEFMANSFNFFIDTITSIGYYIYLFRWAILALFPGAQFFKLVKKYVTQNDTLALVISQVMTGCLVYFFDDKLFRWIFGLIKISN